MKNINWKNVEAARPGEFNRLPAGGYICKITAVEDEPKKEYLKFEFDIAYGEHEGYFRQLYDSKGFWAGHFIKSYKIKAQGFFKQMLECIELSNKNFNADDFGSDERILNGKYIGLVLGYEEYVNNDNNVKQRITVTDFKTAKQIKDNDFEIPTLKTLDGGISAKTIETANADFADDDDFSF